jgi:hypothetical protein
MALKPRTNAVNAVGPEPAPAVNPAASRASESGLPLPTTKPAPPPEFAATALVNLGSRDVRLVMALRRPVNEGSFAWSTLGLNDREGLDAGSGRRKASPRCLDHCASHPPNLATG